MEEYTLYLLFTTNAVMNDGNVYCPNEELAFLGAFRKRKNAKNFVKDIKCDDFKIKKRKYIKGFYEYDGDIFEDGYKWRDKYGRIL